MPGILLLTAAIFLLNLLPAFAPPTWMVLSLVGAKYPDHNLVLISLLAATAATLGRLLLAKSSRAVIRRRFLSQSALKSIDVLREHMQARQRLTAGLCLLYAFTPLPSNYVFIAYGLTAMNLKLLAIPFFIGRFISYNFWAFAASTVSRRLSTELSEGMAYFGAYFIVSQVILIFLVYAFTRIDWRMLLEEKKFRWLAADEKIARRLGKER